MSGKKVEKKIIKKNDQVPWNQFDRGPDPSHQTSLRASACVDTRSIQSDEMQHRWFEPKQIFTDPNRSFFAKIFLKT